MIQNYLHLTLFNSLTSVGLTEEQSTHREQFPCDPWQPAPIVLPRGDLNRSYRGEVLSTDQGNN